MRKEKRKIVIIHFPNGEKINDNKQYTSKEVLENLGISKTTLVAYKKEGLVSIKIGASDKYLGLDIIDFINSRRM